MATGPSRLEGGAETGTPGQLVPRLGARVIDSIVLAIVGVTLGFPLEFGWLWLVAQAVVVFAYFVLLDAYLGTTLGKQLFGLRVTGPDGGRPTIRQAAIREAFTLAGAVPFVGPVLALIAWIVIGVTINASPAKQGKHDELAGGTSVVRA
jgi:uncharacterized RDD family membrane protein YckC